MYTLESLIYQKVSKFKGSELIDILLPASFYWMNQAFYGTFSMEY